jgi:hypothetical protein
MVSQIDAAGFTNRVGIGFDTRVVRLNVVYAFGNQQLKGSHPRETGSEEAQRTNEEEARVLMAYPVQLFRFETAACFKLEQPHEGS